MFRNPFFSFLGSQNVTLVVNDVGGQTLGGAMLDKYIFGADVREEFPLIFYLNVVLLDRSSGLRHHQRAKFRKSRRLVFNSD